ncbi:hypothetical protein HanXRQr2_Chr15g0690161 [Helianthus annuus]|uniref:Uncharacterized protein n=1 Tax=Helianthus annuus TaxID=4232 RepID=A0A9K3H4A4_HELAN|nr:hypothetical protein HanXRQr2_Chr15g0690161 [Helianthus annuus]KAJ0831004.1 hypothetical protein HanPSC8_Chr15g0662031 [Helianthus annuus]
MFNDIINMWYQSNVDYIILTMLIELLLCRFFALHSRDMQKHIYGSYGIGS